MTEPENLIYFDDSSAVRLNNENIIKLETCENIGSGDTILNNNFLSKEEADTAFFALTDGKEINYQQWHHMADKKFNLLPLSRLKITMADVDDNNLIPHYRFPVNNQNQHGIFSFNTSNTIKKIKEKLIAQTGIFFNHAVILLYRDGNDCIGFHKDKLLDLSENSPIASISLGEERSYILRDSIHNPLISQELKLKHGSLLLLGPETNKKYYHSIPIEKISVGQRVSITFRVVTTFKNIKTGEIIGQGEKIKSYDWPEDSYSFHVNHYNELLDFWFGSNRNEYRSGLWWHGIHPTNYQLQTIDSVDSYIKLKWGKILESYDKKKILNLINEKHLLKSWMENIDGIVALMILFDQFPRHIYRGEYKSFSFDYLALQIAEHLKTLYFDELKKEYKMFIFMTLMHTENIKLVSEATLGLFILAESEKNEKWKNSLKKTAKVSQEHYDILCKFGRYPHRNIILERINTIEETDFLAKKYLPMWMKSVSRVNFSNNINLNSSTKVIKIVEEFEPNKKLQILVLHSNRQTSHIFKNKTEKYLEKKLKNIANLTYCDAPKLYEPSGEIKELINNKEYTSVPNIGTTRTWWNATDDPTTMIYNGLENSLEYINSLFKNNNYDGILGFSQGGALAGIISAMVHDSRNNKSVPIKIDNITKSLKFVVIISGFYCRDTRPEFNKCLLENKPIQHNPTDVIVRKDLINIPSFHTWGINDELVNDEIKSSDYFTVLESLPKWFNQPQIIAYFFNFAEKQNYTTEFNN
jgi:uncharacterized protein (DUF924 family)